MDSKELIFEDGHIYACLNRSARNSDNGKIVLITFAPLNFDISNRESWGGGLSNKLDCTVIGIVAKTGNWYPEVSMSELSSHLRKITEGFCYVISYGTSMGGYACLKYSNLLGVTHSIAFSPQFSIAPSVVGQEDKRFIVHYDKHLHERMCIREGDLANNSYVFFDPVYSEDRFNAENIAELKPSVKLVNVRFTHHFPIELFASSTSLSILIELVVNGDELKIRQLVNQKRRKSRVRLRYLAEVVSRKKPEIGLRILDEYKHKLSSDDLLNGYFNIGQFFKKIKLFKEALTCFQNCMDLAPRNEKYIVPFINILSSLGEHDKAQKSAKEFLEIRQSPAVNNALCGAFLSQGKLDEAECAILAAIKYSDLPDFQLRLARIKGRKGYIEQEIELTYKLVIQFPSYEEGWIHLKRCLKRASRCYELSFVEYALDDAS